MGVGDREFSEHVVLFHHLLKVHPNRSEVIEHRSLIGNVRCE